MNVLQKIFSPGQKFILTDEHKKCLQILENTNDNLFITGKAGTGKTALIEYFRNKTTKQVVVLAPTGTSALNIRGQTIHSFFHFPPRMISTSQVKKVFNNRLYKDIDTLVIDEVSMVRADLLDNIDTFLRLNGKDINEPFGGIQVVLVGDLYQLPPVVTYEEQEVFSRHYDTPYFFSSDTMKEAGFHHIELKTVFRQKEKKFIDVLNNIRTGEVTAKTLTLINNQLNPKGAGGKHIILCTTNNAADSINRNRLGALNAKEFAYTAVKEGDFPTEDRILPVELELKLKKGARVLFVKNDKGGQWVNGSLGTVYRLEQNQILVRLDISAQIVDVPRDIWENIRYQYNDATGEIVAKVLGKLNQYPLKLAWAITIHKSQGMSFDTVCVDFSKSPFASGQTYVALSRARTLEGLILTKKIYPNDVMVDPRIVEFFTRIEEVEK